MRLTLGSIAIFVMAYFSSQAHSENIFAIYKDAVNNDYIMKMAGAQLRMDSESYDQALAKYLPQVALSGSYSDTKSTAKQSGIKPVDTSGIKPPALKELADSLARSMQPHYTTNTKNSQWKVALTQEVFNMSYWYGMRSTEHLTKAAQFQFFKSQQDLIVRTTEAYLGVLKAQNNLESSKAEERAYKQQLEQTRQRFKVGLVANTDVQEALSAFDLAKVRRLNDEGALEVSFEALTVLTGKQYTAIAVISDKMPIESPVPAERQDWVNLALNGNPDLNVKRENAEAAKLSAKATGSTRYPTVGFSANYGRGHTDTYNPINNEDRGVMLTLKLPIFTGGSVSSKIRQEYAKLALAKDDLGATERKVNQGVRSAHIETLTSIQSVNARQQSIVSAESALSAVKAGYEYGTRNILDVLQAQKTLYSAKRDYGNSRYDYILNVMKLKQISGILTPEDMVALNQWTLPTKTK